MNPYAGPPFIAGCLNAIVVFWVWKGAREGLLRRTFLFWNGWLGLWNFGVAIGYVCVDSATAYAWYKLVSSTTICWIAPFFLHFVAVFSEDHSRSTRLILRAAYGAAAGLSVLGSCTPLLMKGVRWYFWGFYPLAGKGEWLFGISYFAVATYALGILGSGADILQDHAAKPRRWLLAGGLICFGSGLTNMLPLYGIEIYPIGNLMNSLYSLLIAYAIVEHGLMDVRLVLQRGTLYGLLSGGLTVVYLSIVSVLQKLFGHYGVQENVAFYTAAFPITVVFAPTMKTRIEPFVERVLFGKEASNQASLLKMHNMALMGVLATEMAHELTKPLTHIMNEGSRLGHSAKGLSKEGLSRIEKEAQRAAEILDGFALLSPSRTLHQIAVPIEDLLEETLTALGIENDPTFHVVRHYGNFGPIFVNPGQIVQVFTNIIQNAWQAMRDGGTLTLSLTAPLTQRPPVIEVVIEDTGPGIKPDKLEKVFEPFFTTKQAEGGRGVGLTISQAMVERHGGQIIMESPINALGGTRVRIMLPMKKEAMTHAV